MTGPFSWIHPEPHPRDPSLADGITARTADPLWLLARQIGFGELQGTDNGSPIAAYLTAHTSRITRLRAGGLDGATSPPVPAVDVPIEVLIEAEPEPAPGQPSDPNPPPQRPIAAAQAGLHYLRLLRESSIAPTDLASYREQLAANYPLPDPAAESGGSPLLRLFAGQVPDGQSLYPDLAGLRANPPRIAAKHPLPPGGINAITAPGRAWLDWFDETAGFPTGLTTATQPTWQPGRLEYQASIAAPGPERETVLVSGEHTGGSIDWFQFDIAASARYQGDNVSLGATDTDLIQPPPPLELHALPTPASYPGMPRPRFWQFEDATINLGDITAPTENVLTAVVVEYALRYGNDHYLLPVPLEIGTLMRVSRLVVTTTFGDRFLLTSVAEQEPHGAFRLFEHTLPAPKAAEDQPRDPLFVLFPTTGESLWGTPIEQINFASDDLAGLVWAIEHTALDPLGLPADRSSSPGASSPPAPAPQDTQSITRAYTLRNDIEPNWFPFLPPEPSAPDQTVLRRVEVAPVNNTSRPPPTPWGIVLQEMPPGQPLLQREEVGQAGIQIERVWRYARWTDGRQLCWLARRVAPGRGPATSGLQFDLAQSPPQPPT